LTLLTRDMDIEFCHIDNRIIFHIKFYMIYFGYTYNTFYIIYFWLAGYIENLGRYHYAVNSYIYGYLVLWVEWCWLVSLKN